MRVCVDCLGGDVEEDECDHDKHEVAAVASSIIIHSANSGGGSSGGSGGSSGSGAHYCS